MNLENFQVKPPAKTPKPKPDHHSRNVSPGKPGGVKPTNAEIQKRVRQVADLLSAGYYKSQITEAICSQYGVHWRTSDRYVARARALLMAELGRPREEHRADVLAEYQQMLRDTKTGPADRLAALKGKREILGLDAPRRAEISGPEGAPIAFGEVKVYVPEKRALVPFIRRAGEGNGEADGNGEPGDGHGC